MKYENYLYLCIGLSKRNVYSKLITCSSFKYGINKTQQKMNSITVLGDEKWVSQVGSKPRSDSSETIVEFLYEHPTENYECNYQVLRSNG